MGGNAAKERRRLKRLQEAANQTADNTPKEKPTNTTPASNKQKEEKFKKPQKKNFSTQNKAVVKKNHNAIKSKSKFKYEKNKKEKPSAKKNKINKPKHLARKINAASDPKEMEELLKKQQQLEEKKKERALKFKEKVIKAVGGLENFDEEIFNSLMEKGGGKMETIVEAVDKKKNADRKRSEVSNENDESLEKEQDDDKEANQDDAEENVEIDTKSVESAEDSSSEEEEEKKDKGEDTEETEAPSAAVEPMNDADVDAKNEEPDSSESSTSSSDTDSDSDSDSSDDDEMDNTRSRGRGRRGRKEAEKKRDEQNLKQQEEAKLEKEEEAKPKKPKDTRRCIGRKPVTDFKIGTKYPGTIVYVKPGLGLFLDVKCHSDAFVHISRVADDYVENLEEHFKVGDVLENVRIVDVNRRQKRLTASLQSDARIADEEESMRTHKERLERKAEKWAAKEGRKRKMGEANSPSSAKKFQTELNEDSSNVHNSVPEKQEEVPIIIDPDNMTPAELKRARKLQRRAERRKQQELTGIAA